MVVNMFVAPNAGQKNINHHLLELSDPGGEDRRQLCSVRRTLVSSCPHSYSFSLPDLQLEGTALPTGELTLLFQGSQTHIARQR